MRSKAPRGCPAGGVRRPSAPLLLFLSVLGILATRPPGPASALDASDVNFGFVDSGSSKLVALTFETAAGEIVPRTVLSSASGLVAPRSFAIDLTDNDPTISNAHGLIADPGARKVFLVDLDGAASVIASSLDLLSLPWAVAVSPNEPEDADYFVTDADPLSPLKVVRIVRPQSFIQVLAQSSSGMKQPTELSVVPSTCAGGSVLGGDLVVLDTDAADPAVWRLRGTSPTKLMDSTVLENPVDIDLACGHTGPTPLPDGTIVVADNTAAAGLVFRGIPALAGPGGAVTLPAASTEGAQAQILAQASAFAIDNFSQPAGFVPQDLVFTDPVLGMLVGYVVGSGLATILASGSDGLLSPNDVAVDSFETSPGTADHLYIVTDSSGKVLTVRPSTGETKTIADATLGITSPRAPRTLEDSDGDLLPDILDNCPFNSNPGQEDMDGDGVGDACDLDKDGDGIPNAVDNCPSIPNAGQADADSDFFGDPCDCNADNDGYCRIDQGACEPGSAAGCGPSVNVDCVDWTGECASHVSPPAACDMATAATIPYAGPGGAFTEKPANGKDDDCDGEIDEGGTGGCGQAAAREADPGVDPQRARGPGRRGTTLLFLLPLALPLAAPRAFRRAVRRSHSSAAITP